MALLSFFEVKPTNLCELASFGGTVRSIAFFFFFFFYIRNEEKYIDRRKDTGERRDTKEREETKGRMRGLDSPTLGSLACKGINKIYT